MKRFEFRIFCAVFAASSLLFATRMFAEESTGNWFESVSHVPFEYTAEDTYVGGGDVQRGPNKNVDDFDENDSIVHLVFTPRTKLGILGWDNFNFPFLIGGTYIYSPNLQLVLGVSVDVERKYPVIPAAGLRWKIAPKCLLDAVLPTPRLEFEMTKNLSLYVGANVKQTSYRVDDDFGNANGIPKLNHAILTYSEIRTGAGFDWKISPVVTFTGEVGYQPYRNFDFYRAEVRYHQDGGAPYGTISLHGAF